MGAQHPHKMSIAARPFDIVVFGATGFSGKLLAEYLVKHYISGAKIALGGRSQQKLEKVREALALSEPLAAKIPILIGDSSNLEQLTAIAQQTRCVASTVGPYAKYGAPSTLYPRTLVRSSQPRASPSASGGSPSRFKCSCPCAEVESKAVPSTRCSKSLEMALR